MELQSCSYEYLGVVDGVAGARIELLWHNCRHRSHSLFSRLSVMAGKPVRVRVRVRVS
jgi:hypothetical protein